MDNKEFDDYKEFQEYQEWKKGKDKKESHIHYRPSPMLKTRWGQALCACMIAAVIITAIVLGISQCAAKNSASQPYELNAAEKFLVGKWAIYDIGFEDSLVESGVKAYTTEPKLTYLWEQAQHCGFIFNGNCVDYTESSTSAPATKESKNVFMGAIGNTSINIGMGDLANETMDFTQYNIYAKSKSDNGLLYYYFTPDPSDPNAYDHLIYNQNALYFNNYYVYQENEWDSGYQAAPINSTVVGRRAQALTEKDTLRMTLIPYKSTDRIVWYEFARV